MREHAHNSCIRGFQACEQGSGREGSILWMNKENESTILATSRWWGTDRLPITTIQAANTQAQDPARPLCMHRYSSLLFAVLLPFSTRGLDIPSVCLSVGRSIGLTVCASLCEKEEAKNKPKQKHQIWPLKRSNLFPRTKRTKNRLTEPDPTAFHYHWLVSPLPIL